MGLTLPQTGTSRILFDSEVELTMEYRSLSERWSHVYGQITEFQQGNEDDYSIEYYHILLNERIEIEQKMQENLEIREPISGCRYG